AMSRFPLLLFLLSSVALGRSFNGLDDSPLTKEFLKAGLMHRSAEGLPTVTCLSRGLHQEPVLKECSVEARFDEVSAVCYTLWHKDGGMVQQGCLTKQDVS
ncbi:hypothetical protein PMAYCL1PPCAC_28593, partial [Pristionchus mayeri]